MLLVERRHSAVVKTSQRYISWPNIDVSRVALGRHCARKKTPVRKSIESWRRRGSARKLPEPGRTASQAILSALLACAQH